MVIIIGSGNDIDKKVFLDEKINIEYVICADGGLGKAENLGLMPNIIIGDFDSVNPIILEKYKSLNVEIVKYPSEKDYTDMELAVEYAKDKGFRDLVLLGATGTRLDHSLANILLIEKYYYEGIKIQIIDNNNSIQLVKNNMELHKKENSFVSIIPVTEFIEGVTLQGFKYPLNNVKVQRGSTLCVSNKIIVEKATIEIQKGIALLFISKD